MLVQRAPIRIIDSDENGEGGKKFFHELQNDAFHTTSCKVIHYGIPAWANPIQILGGDGIQSEMCLPLDATPRDETPPAARLRGEIQHNQAFTLQMKLGFHWGGHNPWCKVAKNWRKILFQDESMCHCERC